MEKLKGSIVLTIYFCGTRTKEDWWQGSKTSWKTPELLSTLYRSDPSEKDTSGKGSNYKKIVNGVGSTGRIRDLCNPSKGSRTWNTCQSEALKAVNGVLVSHSGQDLILNLVGFSRGGISCMKMARACANDKKISARIRRINILAFDPVSGETCRDQIGALGKDAKLPAKVEHYVGVHVSDERTFKFEPVIPYCESNKTNVWLFSVSGAHETLVGSNQLSGHSIAARIVWSPSELEELAKLGVWIPPLLFKSRLFDAHKVVDELSSVKEIARIVALELLASDKWGGIKIDPVWFTKTVAEKKNELSKNIKTMYDYKGFDIMQYYAFIGRGFGSNRLAKSNKPPFRLRYMMRKPCSQRLCFIAPNRYSSGRIKDKVYWLLDHAPLIPNDGNEVWKKLREFTRG